MASVDQGASQRRAGGSQGTPIGQASALMPRGSSGESSSNTPLGTLGGTDRASGAARRHEDGVTQIGTYGSTEVSSARGTSYQQPLGTDGGRDVPVTVFDPNFNPTLGLIGGHDVGSSATRVKELLQFRLSATPDNSPAGMYFEPFLGQMTPIGGGGTAVVRYKLRALDDGALPAIQYVYWTSTSVDIGTYPFAPPFGGPLSNLTILARY